MMHPRPLLALLLVSAAYCGLGAKGFHDNSTKQDVAKSRALHSTLILSLGRCVFLLHCAQNERGER